MDFQSDGYSFPDVKMFLKVPNVCPLFTEVSDSVWLGKLLGVWV